MQLLGEPTHGPDVGAEGFLTEPRRLAQRRLGPAQQPSEQTIQRPKLGIELPLQFRDEREEIARRIAIDEHGSTSQRPSPPPTAQYRVTRQHSAYQPLR
jgi:hypothetical protein